jgi:hypothetical protein
VEIAIAKLKKYKSPGSDQIPAELIQAEGEILLYNHYYWIIIVCLILFLPITKIIIIDLSYIMYNDLWT